MLKKTLLWTAGIAVAIQFIRPGFHNPKVDDTVALHTDKHVSAILKNACFDCHSDETKYPWYSSVAPASWFIANDIDEGRKAMDFSKWAKIDTHTRIKRLQYAEHLVLGNMMPPGEYEMSHNAADLTAQQKKTLEQFFSQEIMVLKASEKKHMASSGTLSAGRIG